MRNVGPAVPEGPGTRERAQRVRAELRRAVHQVVEVGRGERQRIGGRIELRGDAPLPARRLLETDARRARSRSRAPTSASPACSCARASNRRRDRCRRCDRQRRDTTPRPCRHGRPTSHWCRSGRAGVNAVPLPSRTRTSNTFFANSCSAYRPGDVRLMRTCSGPGGHLAERRPRPASTDARARETRGGTRPAPAPTPRLREHNSASTPTSPRTHPSHPRHPRHPRHLRHLRHQAPEAPEAPWPH